jgi:hypothetical protein
VAEAKLREQLADLQRQLQASAQHQAAQTAAQRAAAAQQQLDAAVEEAARLQAESTSLQRQLLSLQQQAADLKVSDRQRQCCGAMQLHIAAHAVCNTPRCFVAEPVNHIHAMTCALPRMGIDVCCRLLCFDGACSGRVRATWRR